MNAHTARDITRHARHLLRPGAPLSTTCAGPGRFVIRMPSSAAAGLGLANEVGLDRFAARLAADMPSAGGVRVAEVRYARSSRAQQGAGRAVLVTIQLGGAR